MALTATIYNVDIDLSDADRGVYEALALRVARHPSESEDFLVTRVLAYALEFTEGIEFSAGLSTPDEPAITVKDLTGRLRAWIEVGTPNSDRLHRASKRAERVAVYVHKDPAQFLTRLSGERIHRSEALDIRVLDRALVAALVARLERRLSIGLSVADSELFVSLGSELIAGSVRRLALPAQ